jgi:hypothetical protein
MYPVRLIGLHTVLANHTLTALNANVVLPNDFDAFSLFEFHRSLFLGDQECVSFECNHDGSQILLRRSNSLAS